RRDDVLPIRIPDWPFECKEFLATRATAHPVDTALNRWSDSRNLSIRTVFEQTFKNIDDILHKDAGCTSELDYTEQSSWLLFLKYLDALERDKALEAELEGKAYSYLLEPAYRWENWAAPKDGGGKFDHNKAMTGDDLLA